MTGSFPLIFFFCLRWRECWIRSDPSVIVIITWNINANEDVCQRVNEGSLMWLSGSVHRQTRVLCLFEPAICLQAFAFIRGCLQMCLCWCFPWFHHQKGNTFFGLFIWQQEAQIFSRVMWYLDYGNHHALKWFLSECVIWKLMRDSWLEVENVLCSWFQSFSCVLCCFIVLPKNHSGCAVVFFWMQIINFLTAMTLRY